MTLDGGDIRQPPTEIRIFAKGKIQTTKGTFLFDDAAGKSVMAAWKSYGNDLCFDYEHRAVDPQARAGDGKSAGWFQLELRADGLYAVNIKWTDQAAKQIAAREWRYFSPTFDFDHKSGRILELLNVALTNIPATKNLPALVAASKGTNMTTKTAKKNMKLGLKKTKKTVTETTEEESPDAAAAKPGGVMDDAELDDPNADIAMDDAELDDDADLDADDDGDASMDEDSDGDMAADDDGDDDDAPPAPPPAKKKAPPPAPMKKMAADRVLAAVARVFGTTDADEIEGSLHGYAELRRQTEANNARLARLESSQRKAKLDALIEYGKRTGRILNAKQEAWARSVGLSVLRGFLKTAPKQFRTAEDALQPANEPPVRVGAATLARQEAEIAARFGNTDAYAKAKAEGKLAPSLDDFMGSGSN